MYNQTKFTVFIITLPVTTKGYTLSLHDALPILRHGSDKTLQVGYANHFYRSAHKNDWRIQPAERSEERFSRNAETDLVCRLLLEKKNYKAGMSCLCRSLHQHYGVDVHVTSNGAM